jgi:hypothetical protein
MDAEFLIIAVVIVSARWRTKKNTTAQTQHNQPNQQGRKPINTTQPQKKLPPQHGTSSVKKNSELGKKNLK